MKMGHSDFSNGSPRAREESLKFYWKQFTAEFATEADCLEELYRRAAEEGLLKCRSCGSADIQRKYGARVGRCRGCKKQTWLTAGTFFHRMREARPWLAAIWLMEHGVSFNSMRYQKLVDIAYSSALSIFKKVTTVIQSQMGEDAVAVPSSCFSCLVCRRSRETPARAHPIAEQEEIEMGVDRDRAHPVAATSGHGTAESEFACDLGGEPEATAMSRMGTEVEDDASTVELCELEKKVCGFLSADAIHFDDLYERTGVPVGNLSAALTMLEIAGVATRMPGDWYVSCITEGKGKPNGNAQQSGSGLDCPVEATEAVVAIIRFVREGFQGISRKYLQHYLAAHWCHVDRVRWQSKALLQACLRSRCIRYDEILEYVSPVMVRISPC